MGFLLQDHINKQEGVLLEKSKGATDAGHPNHKGTPREIFVKEFLENRLSELVAIGNGEIFNAQTLSDEKRNQIDIVIYKRNFPRVHFGGDILGFMAESVVATIEIKSALTKRQVLNSIKSAHVVKQLSRNTYTAMQTGYHPPSILSYVVAYDGPAQMKTVADWLKPLHQELHIPYPEFPIDTNRSLIASPSLDGIFVLGKGFLLFENTPFVFNGLEEVRREKPGIRWHYGNLERGSLFLLFVLLTIAINHVADVYLDLGAYTPRFSPFKIGFVG